MNEDIDQTCEPLKDYAAAVKYLYEATPQFQRIGAAAYKPGLETARQLDKFFGSPHKRYPTLHVAGTNGKGSTAHTLAAVLQAAGLNVGLYTSPHLKDFRERMRVNGSMIQREQVVDFVNRYRAWGNAACKPSFFELTTVMALEWFARSGVDVAVIETGLGGRLDTTNIITPVLSVITNISPDHTAQLGDTPEAIAAEKAGIIKPSVPVVIGESDDTTMPVFKAKALECKAPLHVAVPLEWEERATANHYPSTPWGPLDGELTGECQARNAATIIKALEVLQPRFDFTAGDVKRGFAKVATMTGLMGRWQTIGHSPLTVADTGHNTGGWELLGRRLESMPRPLTMVIGFVSDKDVSHILPMMPRDARYIFTQAALPRAMQADRVAALAREAGLDGEIVPQVAAAVARARETTPAQGSIFVGGSTFVVAEALP